MEPESEVKLDLHKQHAEMQNAIRSQCAVCLNFRQIKSIRHQNMEKLITVGESVYDMVRDLSHRSKTTTTQLMKQGG